MTPIDSSQSNFGPLELFRQLVTICRVQIEHDYKGRIEAYKGRWYQWWDSYNNRGIKTAVEPLPVYVTELIADESPIFRGENGKMEYVTHDGAGGTEARVHFRLDRPESPVVIGGAPVFGSLDQSKTEDLGRLVYRVGKGDRVALDSVVDGPGGKRYEKEASVWGIRYVEVG